jgi:hypothetical protein
MCVCAIGPALTAFVLAALLDPIGDVTWTRWGYMLTPDRAEAIVVALLAAGAIALIAGAAMAYRDYRRANDFMGAAGMLDELLEGDEQIVTLATLADPAATDAVKSRRTPLFPVLWRRAIAYLDGFDPVREFRFDIGEPARRSSILAGVVAGAMVLATLGAAGGAVAALPVLLLLSDLAAPFAAGPAAGTAARPASAGIRNGVRIWSTRSRSASTNRSAAGNRASACCATAPVAAATAPGAHSVPPVLAAAGTSALNAGAASRNAVQPVAVAATSPTG